MELTLAQIEFIQRDIHTKGIRFDDLSDSLLDHICCIIEQDPNTDFDSAYKKSLLAFGENGLKTIQNQTIFLLILKRKIIMKKTMYLIGYIALFLSTTGLLFKLQHWPGAAIILTIGIALLNFGFLPMYFYDRYKKAIR